jgi:signal transduction histidine kinase/CheY-like chemotaxis protein
MNPQLLLKSTAMRNSLFYLYKKGLAIFCILFVVQSLTAQTLKNGVLDLRQTNLDTAIITIQGDVDFYWQQLITNEDSLPASAKKFRAYFPSLWGAIKTPSGQTLPDTGFASYAFTILLPKNHTSFAFRVPDYYSNSKIFINGQLLSSQGEVGTSKQTSVPFWVKKTSSYYLPQDTLKVVLQISNFHLPKGGATKPLEFGGATNLRLHHDRDLGVDFLLSGCLLMGGLFFLGLAWFSKFDKAMLYFSLFCILYGLRLICNDNYALHTVLPNINWLFSYRMEYILFYICVGLFSTYIYYLYPQDASRSILNIMLGILTLMCLIVLTTTPMFFASLTTYFLIFILLFISYSIWVFCVAAYKKRPGAIFGLFGNCVAALIFAIIVLNYLKILPINKPVVIIGYIIFFFLQSLIISNRFSRYLIKAKEDAEAGLLLKNHFVATMTHEIRTPLNAVVGLSNIIKADFENKDLKKLSENIDSLAFSAQSLVGIVNNVLHYSKIEARKIEFENIPFNLIETATSVANSFKLLAKQKRIALNCILNNGLPNFVTGDPTNLKQILINLMSNAIKFTSEGGVTLSVSLMSSNNAQQKSTVRFCVEDSGIGINEKDLLKIFNPFVQADSSISRNYGGTGLGLSICNDILKIQNSKLEVTSALNQGTKFWFDIQFITAENQTEAPKTNNNTESAAPLKGLTILLAEDNELNAKIALNFLHRWGADVIRAVDGIEVIDKFEAQPFDLVLMDIQMPNRDGLEAARIIRRTNKTTPILALTANIGDEISREVAAVGMNDIIMKPFKPADLVDTIIKFTN